jgi:hypothetical protein
MGAKFKSREAIYKFFNEPFPGPNNIKEASCKEINENAYKWLKENWKGN